MSYASWFFDNGIKTFPIKRRDKVPACASWDDYSPTKHEAASFGNYGVNLGSGFLGVVDSDTPEVEAWVAAQIADKKIPATPFIVTTARGLHRYYRTIGGAPKFIHRAGHTIEFRNQGQYVVGPGSIHSTGVIYKPASWSWRVTDIPFFPVATFDWEDRAEGQRGSADGDPFLWPEVVHAGERHDFIFKVLRSLQARGLQDLEQLLHTLRPANAQHCRPPIEDGELTSYVRRVMHYKDRPDFVRLDVDDVNPAMLAGELADRGAAPAVIVAAAKAVDPTFDPSGAAPTDAAREKEQKRIRRLEEKLARAKIKAGMTPEDLAASGLSYDDEFMKHQQTLAVDTDWEVK